MDGNGNIDVTAPKNITINAGENIIMSAGQNIVASAQKDINVVAGDSITEIASEDYNLTASNIIETALVGRNSKAKSITENMEIGSYISTKESINMESAKEVNINSGKQVKMQ
jgi:type VI secretion system secreted protein VgrG